MRAVAWGTTLAGAAMLATPCTAQCSPATAAAPPQTGVGQRCWRPACAPRRSEPGLTGCRCRTLT